ncbi:unannotated protein [freshwater metagenome]|uniref:Unannotated protein n=1 Tax=freshwater metagenome TaxID=449393 RepID=A0A6J7F657_9ZZZZ
MDNLITVIYFWEVQGFGAARAFTRMALDRAALRKDPAISFFKLLGTGKGETFTPKDANPRRWGLLVTLREEDLENFDHGTVTNSWRKFAVSEYRAVLKPISSHGAWSMREPFIVEQFAWDGPIAAITRARIKWRFNRTFWRAVPSVTSSLHSSPGLRHAIGIGEAPIGLQGTFSIWNSASDLRNFAYKGAAHTAAIQQTEKLGWYAEELFARFAIIEESGSL